MNVSRQNLKSLKSNHR